MKSKFSQPNFVHAILALVVLLTSTGQLKAEDDILTTAAANGSFKTLVSLVVAADLDDALQGKGSFTVFAPTDDAFAHLSDETLKKLLDPENRNQLANILKYHVIGREISIPKRKPSHPLTKSKTLLGDNVRFKRNGSGVKVNDANVVIRNIRCSNGLIHVIDAVLLPEKKDNSIVGVADKAGSFKTLLAAAKAAGLVEALSGDGPLTVFAPTDKAFSKLPKGTVESLLKPENKSQLERILKYHVVSGKVTAQDAVKAAKAKTLAGDKVAFSIQDGRLTINNAGVTSNDIEAENGIIHIIDSVLLPPEKDSHTSSKDVPAEMTIVSNWNSPVTRDGVKANRLIIRCTGGGRINLTNLQANEVVTRISGGGSVGLEGTAKNHKVAVSGGGVLTAKKFVSDDTTVKVSGGGRAVVHATKNLNASAFAGAKISYVDTGAAISKYINEWATFTAIDLAKTH